MDPRDGPDDVVQLNQVLAADCYFGEEGSRVAVKLEEQIVVRDGAPEVLGGMPFDKRLLQHLAPGLASSAMCGCANPGVALVHVPSIPQLSL